MENERLEELEADNRALREQLDACEDQFEEFEQQANLETGNDTADEDNSIWNRARRFVGDRNE